MTTVRVAQGSQPTFPSVRVGVVVAAVHRGEAAVRLLVGGHEGLDAEGPGDATLEPRTRSVSALRILALVDGGCEPMPLP